MQFLLYRAKIKELMPRKWLKISQNELLPQKYTAGVCEILSFRKSVLIYSLSEGKQQRTSFKTVHAFNLGYEDINCRRRTGHLTHA
jgi:hypothetical protein